MYSYIVLVVLRILVEDNTVAKILFSSEKTNTVRLCRQRQPLLPVVRGARPRINVVLDVLVDGITHNLKRRLDTELYM